MRRTGGKNKEVIGQVWWGGKRARSVYLISKKGGGYGD